MTHKGKTMSTIIVDRMRSEEVCVCVCNREGKREDLELKEGKR